MQGVNEAKITVRVLTQNCWMIPLRRATPPARSGCISGRVNAFGNWMEQQANDHGLDIILLQELWDSGSERSSCLPCLFCTKANQKATIMSKLSNLFTYITAVEPGASCTARNDYLDSGLCIASKHPIVSHTFYPFPMKSPSDSVAKKGILIAGICLPNRKLAIIANAHLDAGLDDIIRFDQLDMCMTVIHDFCRQITLDTRMQIGFTIFGGDLNLDGDCEPVYELLAYRLKRFAFCDMWETFKSEGLGETFDYADGSPQRLDYLWIHPKPAEATVTVSEARLWRADKELLSEIQESRDRGDQGRADAMEKMLDGKNHFQRVTHHGAVLAEFDVA